eukprot:s1270_g4.t1
MQLANPTLQGSGTNRYTQIQLFMPANNPTILQEPKSTGAPPARPRRRRRQGQHGWTRTWSTLRSGILPHRIALQLRRQVPQPVRNMWVVEEEDMEEVEVEEEAWDEVKEEEVETEVKHEDRPWHGKQRKCSTGMGGTALCIKKRGGANASYFFARLHKQHSEFHSWYSRPENRS